MATDASSARVSLVIPERMGLLPFAFGENLHHAEDIVHGVKHSTRRGRNPFLKMLSLERLRCVWRLTLRHGFGRVSGQACGMMACRAGGGKMIKSELVMRLAERYPHLYHRDVERIVSTVLDEISAALAGGDRVELRGFGAFSVKVRPARQGRNPRTGEAVSGWRKARAILPHRQGTARTPEQRRRRGLSLLFAFRFLHRRISAISRA